MKPGRRWASAAVIPVMACVEALAVVISGYLLWVAVSGAGGVAGCGDVGTIDCDHVLASRWSQLASLPVALPAMLLYIAMFAATLLAGRWSRVSVQRRAWWCLVAMATLAALAAVWFIFLQAAVLGAFCRYCMAAHLCSLALFGLVVVGGPRRWPGPLRERSAAWLLGVVPRANPAIADRPAGSIPEAWRGYRRGLLAGVAVAGVMVTVQMLFAPASFTVTAEEEFSASHGPDTPIAGGAGDKPVGPPGGLTAAAGSADRRRPTGGPDDNATPMPAATDHAGSGDSTLRPTRPATEQPAARASVEVAQRTTVPPRALPLLGGKITLPVDQQLLLGPLSAEMLVVTLFDYTCPHCRGMHFQLRAARAHYGDRLAVVLIPVPLNAGCNSAIDATSRQHDFACHYARLALVVWKHNRAAFPQFHDWLFESLDAPPPGVARSRAAKLVTDQPLNEAIIDPWVDDRLRECVEIYRRYDAGQIPKIVMAGRVITGDVKHRKDLYRLIDAAFGSGTGR